MVVELLRNGCVYRMLISFHGDVDGRVSFSEFCNMIGGKAQAQRPSSIKCASLMIRSCTADGWV